MVAYATLYFLCHFLAPKSDKNIYYQIVGSGGWDRTNDQLISWLSIKISGLEIIGVKNC